MAMSSEPDKSEAADLRKVRVLYSYEYVDDGEKIWMEQGEIFDLLNSSGDEWWQVCRAHNPEKSFYVPNTYVVILEEGSNTMMSESPPLNQGYNDSRQLIHGGIEHQNNDAHNNNVKVMSTFKGSMEATNNDDSGEEDYVNSATYSKRESNGAPENFEVKYIHNTAKHDCENDGGDYANLEEIRALAGMQSQQPNPQGMESHYANLPVHDPTPPNLESCEYKNTLSDGWDMFLDPESNRMFYVHKETHQRQWKPPRGQYHKEMVAKLKLTRSRSSGEYDEVGPGIDSLGLLESPTTPRGHRPKSRSVDFGIPIIHLPPSVPEGWMQTYDNEGSEVFVNVASNEKREGAPTSPSKSPDADSRTNVFTAPPVAPKGLSGPSRGQVSDRFAKSRSVMIENLQFSTPSLSAGPPPPKSATLPPNFGTPFTEAPLDPVHGSCGTSAQQSFTSHSVSLNEPIEGMLNKCKIINGKKVSKKWSYSFVKLHGSNLVFYKDQKSSQPKSNSPHGKYDEMVPLGTCSVEKNPKELTSKKNVILLISPECQLLLQAEDERKHTEWYIKIHSKIEELGGTPSKSPSELSPPSPAATGVDRKPSFKGKHKRSPSEAGGTLERKGKIQEILTKFMSSRSDKKELMKKGIYKDAVFGADLKTICDREKSKMPQFVQQFVTAIEKRGLDHEGIYRIGGNISSIQKLRCLVDQGEPYDLDNTELWDVNILTGSLKLFFRELKEPLFTYALFDKFLKSFLKESAQDRLKAIKSTIKELPPYNYETIKFLFKHLQAVKDQSLENKMQAHQLAIVFGPTLIWPEKQTQHLATSMVYQSRIVEYILLEYNNIFR